MSIDIDAAREEGAMAENEACAKLLDELGFSCLADDIRRRVRDRMPTLPGEE